MISKENLLTAYTPYQAEISQGVLQSIFEYQTMICELTGMDVSNASVYDGATAAAEAVNMCCERSRKVVFCSAAAHPDTIAVVKTYCWAAGHELVLLPVKDGKTDLDAMASQLDKKTSACLYLQSPNFFGQLEEMEKAIRLHSDCSKLLRNRALTSQSAKVSLWVCRFPLAVLTWASWLLPRQ